MSGYAAVFHLDGAPVAPVWLEKMADFLAFRGPEGREGAISGSAGMCHALLRTSVERRRETDFESSRPVLDRGRYPNRRSRKRSSQGSRLGQRPQKREQC